MWGLELLCCVIGIGIILGAVFFAIEFVNDEVYDHERFRREASARFAAQAAAESDPTPVPPTLAHSSRLSPRNNWLVVRREP